MTERETEEWRQAFAIVEKAKIDCANRLEEMKSPDWRISEEEAIDEAIEALNNAIQNEEYKRNYPRWEMDCLLRDAALAYFLEKREQIQ